MAKAAKKEKQVVFTLWWFILSFGVETDFLETFVPERWPIAG